MQSMNAIQIVRTVGDNSIALPIPFPPPLVTNGSRQVRRVMIQPDLFEECNVLLSTSTGRIYELGRILAEAIYGHVRHGIILEVNNDNYVRSATQVAIKVYEKSKIRSLAGRTQENPVNEISAMQFLNVLGENPNIIRLIEVLQDDRFVYSVMEYLDGGELYHKLDASGPFDEEQAKFYFLQALNGFTFMQRCGICHRDMSLENLLITKDGRVVIIDFGMSLRLPQHPVSGNMCLIPPQGRCGKMNYMAPEILSNNQPFNGLLSDIWGMGVILFILLCGVPPFDSASPLDPRYRMVRDGNLSQLLEQWEITISPQAIDLLQNILREVPGQRLTTELILQHPWITNTN